MACNRGHVMPLRADQLNSVRWALGQLELGMKATSSIWSMERAFVGHHVRFNN